MPGSVAVFLYWPQLAERLTNFSGVGNLLVFFIPAWIVGIVVNVISLHVPLRILGGWRKWSESKWNQTKKGIPWRWIGFYNLMLPGLGWACGNDEMKVENKVFCAFPEMLRGLILVSLCVLSLPPENFSWGCPGVLRCWAGLSLAACCSSWILLHVRFKELQSKHEKPDGSSSFDI
jgi:hypothetical protein